MPNAVLTRRITLTDYDWHPVGTPEEQYKVKAICSNALEMCALPASITPTASTPAFFWLGGQVNNVRTRPGFQNWIRATVIPSEYIQNPADDEGFDELSGIRVSIAELQTNVIGLSNRVLNIELWRSIAVRDWNILKYQLNHRIDHMYRTLARLIKIDAELTRDIFHMRMKIPQMITQINNLKNSTVSRTEFEIQIEKLLKAIAKNTRLDVKTIEQLIDLEFRMIKCREDIQILYTTKTSGSSSGGTDIDNEALTSLSTKVTELEHNLNLYWEVCIAMVTATTPSAVTALYNTFLNSHTVPDAIKSTLKFAYDQAIKIVSGTVVDTGQDTEITEINDFLDGVLVGRPITASDLLNMETGSGS